uniref:Mitotic spindle assembly checkpoint protein MAD1 n=1 Tax=Sphaeramia orbicularis TaxID=375764 RepID=A0A672Z588_9TELE
NMDLEDDTTVLTTLKSFNSFISRSQPPQPLPECSGYGGSLQSTYERSMGLLEAAERVNSKNKYFQLDQEKKQMELSHKRARLELEKAASDNARDFKNEVEKNQDLLGRIKRLEERESEASRNLEEQVEANRALRKNLEGLTKKLEERDTRLNTANQTISSLKDEVRVLTQKIQNQDSTLTSQTLEKEELQEQLDLQRRKYQEVSQLCKNLQAAQSSCSEHVIKIKELERRLALQEQDFSIVKNVKSEVARVPDLEKELKRLREENALLRESRENCSLLKEEVEGLRRKLERTEKTIEDLVNMELEKEVKGSVTEKPEDLSREVIQIQQREITLKEQNYTLNSRVRSTERLLSELNSELSQQHSKTLEEQKKREAQDSLVRRLQKRVLLLTKERDGMRSILESYDSELASTEYSPQLNKRVREAEDMLQKIQSHNVEMEVCAQKHIPQGFFSGGESTRGGGGVYNTLSNQSQFLSVCMSFRQKIEDLEAERQRLEEQNNILEMRLERHNLQGDYDPVKTRVLHFKMNPTAVAKQQRQQEMESLQEEVTRLRELVRSLQDGGAQDDGSILTPNLSLSLPPSKEVLDLRKQMESSELKNQRLKEVFQKKIQEFRTVCYVLTGYQIDITTTNQYRLTSVYAEHMDDSLASSPGGGSMHLMETEFSKTLGEMVDLHLHHQKSIPAFLSAVTLDLFSRQTTV